MISYTDVDLEGKQFNEWEVVTMKNFDLNIIKFLIDESLKEEPTGDDWLDSRYNEQVHFIGHTNPYYKLFYLIAKYLQPGLTIELGSWQATGAAHFAAGNPAGEVVTVDIHREDKAAQLRAIEAAGHYENLTYLNHWTWDAVPFIQNLNIPIDIFFIDAWHDYQYAKKEWDLYSPLLASPALVICDDITTAYNFDGMLKFWEEMPEPKFLFSNGLHGDIPMGFVIVNQKLNNELQTKELIEKVSTETMFNQDEIEKAFEESQKHVGQDRGTVSIKSTGTPKRGRPRKES